MSTGNKNVVFKDDFNESTKVREKENLKNNQLFKYNLINLVS